MLRIVVIGMGPIGIAAARAASEERDMRLVGLVDVDPVKAGKSLDDLNNPPTPHDAHDSGETPRIAVSLADALKGARGPGGADVAIISTTSKFDRLAPTLRECLSHRLAVVTSCEEMAWPQYQHATLADAIDGEAKAAGRALLATGVNPGFVMDALAVYFTTAVRRVTAVRCTRRVDAALRRVPLQAKVGANMTVDEFNALARANKLGHVGIGESVAMLAAGLGRRVAPGSVTIQLAPVIAHDPLRSALGLIQPGRVAGIHNTAHWSGDGLTIDLDLTMAVGVTDPRDTVELAGPVPLKLNIPGGTPGDSATVATLINAARKIVHAPPGLRTMLDMPPLGASGVDR